MSGDISSHQDLGCATATQRVEAGVRETPYNAQDRPHDKE